MQLHLEANQCTSHPKMTEDYLFQQKNECRNNGGHFRDKEIIVNGKPGWKCRCGFGAQKAAPIWYAVKTNWSLRLDYEVARDLGQQAEFLASLTLAAQSFLQHAYPEDQL